mmetsp:Transcript_60590/g.70223  ORF Transcript_60590/g.70223 Transcript_60590/m.70223 type:complete len:314 (-) Transcript_60590:230-1171(-)
MDRTMIAIDRDNLTVCCDVDNTLGQEPVKSIEISLVNFLTYKADYITEKNRVVAGRHFLEKEIPPGQKAQIAGTIPLPRNIVPSLTTFNLQSDYVITIELNIPWASDPQQTFNVTVAQSVDESNYSPPILWKENKYVRLMKGQFSVPESYYQPPPQPVYQCVPIPLPPPPNAAFLNYNINIPALGLPSASWEQNQPMIHGQPVAVEPLGIQWSGGYDGSVSVNYSSPTVQVTTTSYTSTNYNGVRTTEEVVYNGGGYDPYAVSAAANIAAEVAMVTADCRGTMEVRVTERFDDGTTVTADVTYGDGMDAPLLS